MSIRATRAVRLLFAAAFAWLGLALFAQAALATHGRIQVSKVNAGGNPADTFSFHRELSMTMGAAPAQGDFTLSGGGTSDFWDTGCNADRPGHNDHCQIEWPGLVLKITEQPKAGYALTSVVCRYTQADNDNNQYAGQPTESSPLKPANEYSVDLATGLLTFNVLHYDEWVRCWFTNMPVATPPSSGSSGGNTSGTTPAKQPQSGVSPERATPGSARLAGPHGCPTTNAAAATVSGKRIVKVTFYVDNRKVKVLTKPNKKGRWTLTVNMRRIGFGSHRVRAKVEFAKSSGTETKNLRLSFNRCHGGNISPQFTG